MFPLLTWLLRYPLPEEYMREIQIFRHLLNHFEANSRLHLRLLLHSSPPLRKDFVRVGAASGSYLEKDPSPNESGRLADVRLVAPQEASLERDRLLWFADAIFDSTKWFGYVSTLAETISQISFLVPPNTQARICSLLHGQGGKGVVDEMDRLVFGEPVQ